MGMTLAEKILSVKSGRSRVAPGEIVDAYPDLVMSHTATWRSVSVMKRIGATKLYDPDRLAIVLDHVSPAKLEKHAADQQISRNFAREYGIRKFYDIDAGIAHLVLMEAGHVAPGDLIVGTDSHCTIYGSLGALGTGIGYTEGLEISRDGLRFCTDKFLPADLRLDLDLDLGPMTVTVRGARVAWSAKVPHGEGYNIGLEFSELPPEEYRGLMTFLGKLHP